MGLSVSEGSPGPDIGINANLKRQSAPVGAQAEIPNPNDIEKGATAITNTTFNNGGLAQGSLSSRIIASNARIANPIGNSAVLVNKNTYLTGNAFKDVNWNVVSGNEGTAFVGNHNVIIPFKIL
ncbi:hypothetical protein GGI12_006024 [Dipsacomyces acuminosporus]|nr:hypothetical protein GGI12_006024 [Dipsacomyces acuminosporus]